MLTFVTTMLKNDASKIHQGLHNIHLTLPRDTLKLQIQEPNSWTLYQHNNWWLLGVGNPSIYKPYI